MLHKEVKIGLLLSLLLSVGSYNHKANANTAELVIAGTVLAGASALTYLCFSLYSNHVYNQALLRYGILNNFREKRSYTYENLKEDATQQYYDNYGCSSSLENDYPVVWLEKDATAKKNFLGWMFLSAKMPLLSKKLAPVLHYLRRDSRFKAERKEFNKEFRQQQYRDEKLRLEHEKLAEQRRDRWGRD